MNRFFGSLTHHLVTLLVTLLTTVLIFGQEYEFSSYNNENSIIQSSAAEIINSESVYLPLIMKPSNNTPVINLPFFEEPQVVAQHYHQAAMFWFGQVNYTENNIDVRAGYHPEGIFVRLSVLDRYLWNNDLSPSIEDLEQWDTVSLYIDLDGGNTTFGNRVYRFVAELGTSPKRNDLQAVYQKNLHGWNLVPLLFYSSSGWKGGLNNNTEDDGYVLTFHIPFNSLGLTTHPEEGKIWSVAISINDRDNEYGSSPDLWQWPQNIVLENLATWGKFSFGLPTYTPPESDTTQTIILRHGLDGVQVLDGVVGGNTLCGQGSDDWEEWGSNNYAGARDMNVQNQGNIDDWRCFSKLFITFPLDSLPANKIIVSATLTLSQSGQSTGFDFDPPEALTSLIQVFQVNQSWEESTLTWNNSPQVQENISQTWVETIEEEEWAVPWTWDVSRAVIRAYSAKEPLRLALYSADNFGPNGKYFLSSETGDYAEDARPTLTIILGE